MGISSQHDEEARRVKRSGAVVTEVAVQKKLESTPRTNLENTSLNPLKLFPGISFSMMFRFLWVSRIYRRRMAMFCGKKYDLELNLVLILLAASESHLQQGILAGSLGINKSAMVFLIDNLEIRRLIDRKSV